MIKADVEVKLSASGAKKLDDSMKRALVITMYLLQDRIREEQVIPRDMGYLQGEKFYVDDRNWRRGKVNLVNEGPYARRLYYHPEYNFQHESWVDGSGVQHGGNVNAQGLWFTLWQKGGYFEKEPQEIYEKVLAGILKGDI